MVPDRLSLSRRQLLGGVAGLAGGSAVAVGATVPTALPDVLTDFATRIYPTPPDPSSLWRPPVTESHAREVVTLLSDTVSRGERLWKQAETDDDFLGAGGWLENARKALRRGNYHEALSDATYGMQFAGEALGVARAKLGDADLQNLAERGADILARSRGVAEDITPYPTVEPARDLAWYYRIERELTLCRQQASWGGMETATDGVSDENGPDASKYDPRDVGSITAGLLQAEIYLRNAERYRDLLAEKIGSSARQYAAHLRDTVEQFETDIARYPTRDTALSNYVERDGNSDTPYEFARSRLVRWCFDVDYRFGSDHGTDLLAHRAVSLSKGLVRRRAFNFALRRLAVDEDDEGFDSGHTLAEKRRAQSVYRSVVGSNPPPLLTVQVARAVEDLQVATVGFAGSYQRPLWRERLQAYLYALLGRAKLTECPAVHETLVGETP